jgi:hypothetical protein
MTVYESRAEAWLELHGHPIDDLAARAYHVWGREALKDALGRLEGAGVPALVVKGAVLAYLLYDDPIERPILDVDLRVRPRDLAAAVRALTTPTGSGVGRLLIASRAVETAVVSLRKFQVDVEGHVGPRFLCAMPVERLLERAVRTDEGLGFAHLRPELHDHLILLALNLFKDRHPGGRWRLRDLQRLARLAAFDPDVLAHRAEEGRCTTIVHVVARSIAERGDDARWGEIAERISPARPRHAARVLATMRGERHPPLLAWQLEVRGASDSPARSVAAIVATALHGVESATRQHLAHAGRDEAAPARGAGG